MWPLYAFLAVKWQLYDDIATIATGRMSGRPFPRPRGVELVVFAGGKLIFLSLAFGLPLLLHSVWTVLGGLPARVCGDRAHPQRRLPAGPLRSRGRDRPRARLMGHAPSAVVGEFRALQPAARLVRGRLNRQIEHHLFPQICHLHYPALAPIVEDTCREFAVRYTAHPTFHSAVAAHYRQLRAPGRADWRTPGRRGP
jgi:linoleoyl-CoA desaturase